MDGTDAPPAAGPVQSNRPRVGGRIVGLDIARFFAIVGMVFVNFKITMGAESSGPTWLRFVAALFDGRAAATFVVLAGIGASLGSRRAREAGEPTAQRAAQATLLKRALFLFALGWAFFPIWPADILHYYGAYLAVGASLLFASNGRLVFVAISSVIISSAFIVALDPFANWDLDDYSYRGITTPSGFLRNLLLDGFHPVFPWVAFYLFGMWLGRTDLRDRAWRHTLVIRSACVVAIAELTAWIVLGPKGSSLDQVDDQSWRWIFNVGPIPPLPLYLVAGAGTAVLAILGSVWLGERLSPRSAEPLVSTGQLALTVYLAHVVVGMGLLDALGRLEDQSLIWATATSLGFSIAVVPFCWAWRRRHARGPLEWVMRRVAG